MERSSVKLQEHHGVVTSSILKNLVPNCFIPITPINQGIWKHTFYIVTFWIWSNGFNSMAMRKACCSLPSTVTWYILKKCLKQQNFEKQSGDNATGRAVSWEVSIAVPAEDSRSQGDKSHTSDNWNMWKSMEQLLLRSDTCAYLHMYVCTWRRLSLCRAVWQEGERHQ